MADFNAIILEEKKVAIGELNQKGKAFFARGHMSQIDIVCRLQILPEGVFLFYLWDFILYLALAIWPIDLVSLCFCSVPF